MDDAASTRYILPCGVMTSMSAYLDSVINKLAHALEWAQKDNSIGTANAAIREMHLSFRRYICRQECHSGAYALPDTYATTHTRTSPEPSASTLAFNQIEPLPNCRGLCWPFFGLENWPQNNDHWRRVDMNDLPDCALRDRNWVPIATPLAHLAELPVPRGPQMRELHTLSPLQRFLASGEPADMAPTSYLSSATDTGYASVSVAHRPRALAGCAYDTHSSNSSSSSYTRKRRYCAEDIPSRLSSSPEPDGPVSRQRKRVRRHSSFPYVVPEQRRIVQRHMTAPTAPSTTCVASGSASGWGGMDVDTDADESVYRESESESRGTGSSDDSEMSNTASVVLDQGDPAALDDDMDARPASAPWWGEVDAAADRLVEDHSPTRPSRWLRVLRKLFYWQT